MIKYLLFKTSPVFLNDLLKNIEDATIVINDNVKAVEDIISGKRVVSLTSMGRVRATTTIKIDTTTAIITAVR
jgi:hypothetical protein